MSIAIIKVNHIWIEDLFEWMYKKVLEGGGDEFVALFCENYKESAYLFEQYCKYQVRMDNPTFTRSEFNIVDEGDHIRMWRIQDGLIFSNKINYLPWNEYNFVVDGECELGFGGWLDENEEPIEQIKLQPIKEVLING